MQLYWGQYNDSLAIENETHTRGADQVTDWRAHVSSEFTAVLAPQPSCARFSTVA